MKRPHRTVTVKTSKTHFVDRPSLRDINLFRSVLAPGGRDIQASIASAIFLDILITIRTRADDVTVPFTVAGGQATRAAHVTVSFTVQQKGMEEIKNFFPVPIEEISARFMNLSQGLVELFHRHRPSNSERRFSLKPMTTVSSTRIVGKLHAGLY